MDGLISIFEAGASAATGGLIGALIRFVPELLKIWTAKADRAHEIAMRKLDKEISESGAEQRIRQADVEGAWAAESKQIDALREALAQQGKITGIRFIDAMNQSVRPVITYWLLGLYSVMKFVMFAVAQSDPNVGPANALPILWGYADTQMLFGIISFWFVDRQLGKRAQGI